MAVTEMVVPALAAGILAMVGSAFGAWIALGRFKRERAYDLQVEWYRSAVRALMEAARATGAAATNMLLTGADQVTERTLDGLLPAVERMSRIALEAKLFATPKTARSLSKMVNDFGDLDAKRALAAEHGSIIAGYEHISSVLAAGAHQVAAEGRKVLKLKKLAPEDVAGVSERA